MTKFTKTLVIAFALALISFSQAFAGERLTINNATNKKIPIIKALMANGQDWSNKNNRVTGLREAKGILDAHYNDGVFSIDIDELKKQFPDVSWNLGAMKNYLVSSGYYSESDIQHVSGYVCDRTCTPAEAAEAAKDGKDISVTITY